MLDTCKCNSRICSYEHCVSWEGQGIEIGFEGLKGRDCEAHREPGEGKKACKAEPAA